MNHKDLIRSIQSSTKQFQNQNRSYFRLNEQSGVMQQALLGSKDKKSFIDVANQIKVDPKAQEELLANFDKNMEERNAPSREEWEDYIKQEIYDKPENIKNVNIASINRAEAEEKRKGIERPEHWEKLRKRAEKSAKETRSQLELDKLLKNVENVADVAGTVATLGLLFTPAAPVGLALSGGQAGTDYYKAAMTDDPSEKEEYKRRGTERAIGTAFGAGLLGAGAVAQRATSAARGMAPKVAEKAAELAPKIPGGGKAIEAAKTITQKKADLYSAISKIPSSVAGSAGGGVAGTALGYSMIEPDDSAVEQVAKVLGLGIAGSLLGSKGVGYLQQKIPQLGTPLRLPTGTPAKKLARELETIEPDTGTVTLQPRAGREFPAGTPKLQQPKPIEMPAQPIWDSATGKWTYKVGRYNPPPASETLPARVTQQIDYGYPRQSIPSEHLAAPPRPLSYEEPVSKSLASEPFGKDVAKMMDWKRFLRPELYEPTQMPMWGTKKFPIK